MANSAPPPYSEQQGQPAYNPSYAAAPPNVGYPPANPGYPPYGDPSKNYPPGQPGYPPAGQYPPQGAYPPGAYPPGAYPPPGAGYPQPGPAYPVAAPAAQGQQQQQTIVVTTGQAATGNCPVCRAGFIVEDFTCCGICLAIFFFPLGLICCLLMRDRRCSRCGAHL